MPMNDIHNLEKDELERTLPSATPNATTENMNAATTAGVEYDDVDLAKRAFNFFGPGDKKVAPQNQNKNIYESPAQSKTRGKVTDPEHDRRLKENREKPGNEQEERHKQEQAKREKEEVKEKQERSLRDLSRSRTRPVRASENEEYLRKHYKFGKLFTVDQMTKNYLEKMYNDMKNREKSVHTAEEKQEYAEVISHIANLMIEKGHFKK